MQLADFLFLNGGGCRTLIQRSPFYALPEPPPEPDPIIPLNAYNLSQPEGRFAFLWALYNDYQEDGLLMAVNHVWDCLDKPRGLRCALMAQKVGKTGTGKPCGQGQDQALSLLHHAHRQG
jgi:hypothetical protein